MSIKPGIVIIMLLCVVLLTAGCEKDKLDKQMAELCQKDGGIKIYETVKLPPEYFDQSGHVKTSIKKINGEWVSIIADKYVAIEKSKILKEGDPLKGEGRLSRVHVSIKQIADEKVIAEAIQYRRAGGDGFYLGHHTQNVCPNYPMELNDKIFIKTSGGKE